MDDRRNHPHCGSPVGITMLLEAHWKPGVLGNGSPADKEAIRHLLDHGMIEPKDGHAGCYQTTSKGAFHVKALGNLPFPEAVSIWVTPKAE